MTAAILHESAPAWLAPPGAWPDLKRTEGADVRNLTLTPAEEMDFWDRVGKRGPDECWPWLGTTNDQGYGIFQPGGRIIRAHRLALFHTRPFDPALHVLHSCDNPPCCNPAHLRAGTQADNMADAVARGRMRSGPDHGLNRHPERVPRGERNGQAKLTATDVAEIRARYAAGGVTQQALADRFGVCNTQINRILKGTRWAERTEA